MVLIASGVTCEYVRRVTTAMELCKVAAILQMIG